MNSREAAPARIGTGGENAKEIRGEEKNKLLMKPGRIESVFPEFLAFLS